MNKKSLALASLLLLCALLAGCVLQKPVLTDEPMPALTPEPLPAIQQSLTFESGEFDALGDEIFDPGTHYNKYLKFQNLRVYEYGGDTLLDGICLNGYPEPLYGAFLILFRDKDATLVAEGTLYFDEDPHLIPPGETRLFASINTDMSIVQLPLTIVYDEIVRPYSLEDAAR